MRFWINVVASSVSNSVLFAGAVSRQIRFTLRVCIVLFRSLSLFEGVLFLFSGLPLLTPNHKHARMRERERERATGARFQHIDHFIIMRCKLFHWQRIVATHTHSAFHTFEFVETMCMHSHKHARMKSMTLSTEQCIFIFIFIRCSFLMFAFFLCEHSIYLFCYVMKSTMAMTSTFKWSYVRPEPQLLLFVYQVSAPNACITANF